MSNKTNGNIGRAFRRGAFGKCPKCGEGALFAAYLKHVDACGTCNESYAEIDAADGPAWFTMILVGALLMPFAFIMIMAAPLPTWLTLIVLLVLVIVVTLAVLPRVKGAFIGVVWANQDRE
ncbi:MAG: DUF983 domain-containing protein [Hyphomonadaceae bacterium]